MPVQAVDFRPSPPRCLSTLPAWRLAIGSWGDPTVTCSRDLTFSIDYERHRQRHGHQCWVTRGTRLAARGHLIVDRDVSIHLIALSKVGVSMGVVMFVCLGDSRERERREVIIIPLRHNVTRLNLASKKGRQLFFLTGSVKKRRYDRANTKR